MPSLDDIARHQTSLDKADVAWLHALVADWQIIADLSFADLVLWVPDAESKGFWAAAQIRPTTGPTSLIDDVVGTFVPAGKIDVLERAMASGDILESVSDEWQDGVHVGTETIAVRRAKRTIGVLARRTNLAGVRTPSNLESAYRDTAKTLLTMISAGEFPIPGERSELADSLRVGDGFVRTDAKGVVSYASPNALSAYRRIGLSGDLVGADLAQVTQTLVGSMPTDSAPLNFLGGRVTEEAELENPSASLLIRVIPLRSAGARAGTVILLRDVTELRLRERELVSKEATIREIHHRVKNNLQTVAALLRLQGRRMDNPEARIALDDAVRRVGSIALVHETLSQSFDQTVEFDEIADKLLLTVLDVSATESSGSVRSIKAERIGTFGSLPGNVATPLAMVLTELIQNAAQHAFDPESTGERRGHIALSVNRIRDRIRMRVSDDGVGLGPDFDPLGSLGLSIVTTLVETELGGTLAFERGASGGTTVNIQLTLG
ncbi:MAG: sensor histidine kinase [Aeromicrobium sp.]